MTKQALKYNHELNVTLPNYLQFSPIFFFFGGGGRGDYIKQQFHHLIFTNCFFYETANLSYSGEIRVGKTKTKRVLHNRLPGCPGNYFSCRLTKS